MTVAMATEKQVRLAMVLTRKKGGDKTRQDFENMTMKEIQNAIFHLNKK